MNNEERLRLENELLMTCSKAKMINKYLDAIQEIKIMENYFELIVDIGYDYDGLSGDEDLKNLIDEMVHYASLGRVCNTNERIYVNGDKDYNILGEEIK